MLIALLLFVPGVGAATLLARRWFHWSTGVAAGVSALLVFLLVLLPVFLITDRSGSQADDNARGSVRLYFTAGWYGTQADATGRRYDWMQTNASVLIAPQPNATPARLALSFDATSFRVIRKLTIRLSGQPVATRLIAPGVFTHTSVLLPPISRVTVAQLSTIPAAEPVTGHPAGLAVALSNVQIGRRLPHVAFGGGWYGEQVDASGRRYDWMQTKASLSIFPGSTGTRFVLSFDATSFNVSRRLTISVSGQRVATRLFRSGVFEHARVSLPPMTRVTAVQLSAVPGAIPVKGHPAGLAIALSGVSIQRASP